MKKSTVFYNLEERKYTILIAMKINKKKKISDKHTKKWIKI